MEERFNFGSVKGYERLVVSFMAVEEQLIVQLSESARHYTWAHVVLVEQAAYHGVFLREMPATN